jgi:hypothetical protein
LSSTIDVTSLIDDPEFNDTILVNGVSANAVVWPEEGQSLTEMYRAFGLSSINDKSQAIRFVTKAIFDSIKGAGNLVTITWKAKEWLCKVDKDYRQWGEGFVECVAVLMPALYPHTITVWAPPVPDGLGGFTFSAPETRACRFHHDDSSATTADGRIFGTAYQVYTAAKLDIDVWIFKGTSTATDPRTIDAARVTRTNPITNQSGDLVEWEALA